MQGFSLYDKKLVRLSMAVLLAAINLDFHLKNIQFAKSKSYATMKEEGNYSKFLAQKRKGKALVTQPAAAVNKLKSITAVEGEPGSFKFRLDPPIVYLFLSL